MIDNAQLKLIAKEQIRGTIGTFFLCYLIIGAIAGASAFLVVGPVLLYPPFMMAIYAMFLGLTRGEKPQVEGVFKGFQTFGKSLMLILAMEVFVCLWSLLLIVPGIIKAISYMFAPYILIENPDMAPMDALRESQRITNGHKKELFMLGLSFIPWLLLCMVTCGIATIYVWPFMMATYTNAYLRLKDAFAPQREEQ